MTNRKRFKTSKKKGENICNKEEKKNLKRVKRAKILCGQIHFEGHWKGWALKIETFRP